MSNEETVQNLIKQTRLTQSEYELHKIKQERQSALLSAYTEHIVAMMNFSLISLLVSCGVNNEN